jgi:hypothetical protein
LTSDRRAATDGRKPILIGCVVTFGVFDPIQRIYAEPANIAAASFVGRLGADRPLPISSLEQAALYAADSVTRRGTQKAYASADQFRAFCEAVKLGEAGAE